MLHLSQTAIDQLIVPATLTFFFLWGLVAVAISVALIAKSPRIFQLFAVANRYVSSRSATKPMGTPRDSGPFIWQHQHSIGMVFVSGAAYSLWGLIFRTDSASIASILNWKFPPGFVLWIVDCLRYLMIFSCAISLVVGVLILFFPDTMKSIENVASRWYATRRIVSTGDKMRLTLDKLVAAYPQKAGLILVFPALAIVVYFGGLLFQRI